MPVQLGARPEHGFDQPLGLLSDCHRRIEHFLGVLEKVVDSCRGGPLGDEQRRAAEAALTYFDVAAPRHTQDEEQSLFPLLRGSESPDAQRALQVLAALEADHAAGDLLHARIRSWLRRWLDAGPLGPESERSLEDGLRTLRKMYLRHIDIEEREVFPLAGRVLNTDQLRQVGREMAVRRGLAPG